MTDDDLDALGEISDAMSGAAPMKPGQNVGRLRAITKNRWRAAGASGLARWRRQLRALKSHRSRRAKSPPPNK